MRNLVRAGLTVGGGVRGKLVVEGIAGPDARTVPNSRNQERIGLAL